MQGVGVRSRFSSKLVYKGGDNMDLSSCLLKLAGAEKVSAQDGVPSSMFCLLKLIEVLGNGICDGCLARASLAGHPEDRRAVRRDVVSPCKYLL